MIRFSDAVVLAYTKLRTHKIRTGITTGVAGILFGLILGVIMVATGIFYSVDQFSKEGLGDRTILTVSNFASSSFQPYEHLEDDTFITEVEQARTDYITNKAQIAKKYGITYNPNIEDVSPIAINKTTHKKYIPDEEMGNTFVQLAANKHYKDEDLSLDINKVIQPYSSALVLHDSYAVTPSDRASFEYMRNGKELEIVPQQERVNPVGEADSDPVLNVGNASITQPFVLVKKFDYTKGEIPVIVSFHQAEKLLGLKTLAKESTNQQKLDRLQEVRQRIGEVTASFCYRNQASKDLLTQAMAQAVEVAKKAVDASYQYTAPPVQYAVPAIDSCGEIKVVKDTRTIAEKAQAETYKKYQQELGVYGGNPVQHKVTVRGVGVAGDTAGMESMTGSIGQMVSSLLGSWLSYGNYLIVPAHMLQNVPETAKPSYLFTGGEGTSRVITERAQINEYLVEFTDKEQARDLMNKHGGVLGGGAMNSDIYVSPFGNAGLLVDEIKIWFGRILWWTLMVVGGVALVILASLIGRMISDGRRESAIFRAIGARRSDIGGIYGVYTLMLSARVAVFAFCLGVVLALIMEYFFAADATLSARLAYAASDTTKNFHLIGFGSWYIAIVLAAIIVVGLVASVIPILLGARRSPIKDMRDDS